MPNTNDTFTYKFSDGTTVIIPEQHRRWLSITDKGNIGFTNDAEWQKKLDAKEAVWNDLPKEIRDAYAWRKATFAKEETIKAKMLDDVLAAAYKVLDDALAGNAEALLALNKVKDTVKKLQKKTSGKYSLMAKLFGKESVAVGDSTPFSAGIISDLAKIQAKGYDFKIADNKVIITKVPAAKAA